MNRALFLPLLLLPLLLTSFTGHAGPISDHFNIVKVDQGFGPISVFGDKGTFSTDRYKVQLAKTSLGVEMLMFSNLINQVPLVVFSGLKTRIVSFEQRDDRILMFESPKTIVLNPDFGPRLLVAEFPVSDENDDFITFDFNAGMKRLFMAGDWKSSDFGMPNDYRSVEVFTSYIDQAHVTENNFLVIDQVAQINTRNPMTGDEATLPVIARYSLTPYQENPNFNPTKLENFDRYGAFQVSPLFDESGTPFFYASKFDINKPIRFAISANTPDEYKEAVRDGIVYWNKALGREIVEAIEAPAGVYAPDVRYNMVQWVDWDTAGFAFANGQMDPRTGEILMANVFFTSSFAFNGLDRARALLRKLEAMEEQTYVSFTLQGFEQQGMCQMPQMSRFKNALASLLAEKPTDEQLLKFSRDYVAEVVAHEVGHAIGLRHNFAGSLASNISLSDKHKHFVNYLQNGKAPDGVVPSSSVMDYHELIDGVIIGDIVASEEGVLSYDKMVVETLYNGKEFPWEDWPLFCTDSHRGSGKYLDCRVWDSGASPVETAYQSYQDAINQLPVRLLERYISEKTTGQTSMANVSLTANRTATSTVSALTPVLKLLNKGTTTLRINRSFPSEGGVFAEARSEAKLNYLDAEFDRFGGLLSLFAPMAFGIGDEGFQRFAQLLDENTTGTGFGGKEYTFSADEKKVMKKHVKLFFSQWENLAISAFLEALKIKDKTPLEDHQLAEDFAHYLHTVASSYLFEREERVAVYQVKIDGETLNVELPTFSYSHQQRVQAAQLLSAAASSEDPTWGLVEKKQLFDELQALIKKAFEDKDTSKLKSSELPRPVARWLLENQALLDKLK